MNADTINLDVRTLHEDAKCRATIFENWEKIKPGQTLRITNSHDPQPLKGRFERIFTNQFSWEYELRGPEIWIIRITKR
ncbi:MAG: DUF2249 domain-containing protein [Candidatus Thorarchaeota archaeon]